MPRARALNSIPIPMRRIRQYIMLKTFLSNGKYIQVNANQHFEYRFSVSSILRCNVALKKDLNH